MAYVIRESGASGITLGRLEASAVSANIAGVGEVGTPNCAVADTSAARSWGSLSDRRLSESHNIDAKDEELRS